MLFEKLSPFDQVILSTYVFDRLREMTRQILYISNVVNAALEEGSLRCDKAFDFFASYPAIAGLYVSELSLPSLIPHFHIPLTLREVHLRFIY
jgi:hypothetical protein